MAAKKKKTAAKKTPKPKAKPKKAPAVANKHTRSLLRRVERGGF